MFNFFKTIFIDMKVPKTNKRPIATFYSTSIVNSHIPFSISYCEIKRDKRHEFQSMLKTNRTSRGAYTA